MIQTFMQNSISLPAFPRSPPHGGGGEGWEEKGARGGGYAGEILQGLLKILSTFLYPFLGTFLDREAAGFFLTYRSTKKARGRGGLHPLTY